MKVHNHRSRPKYAGESHGFAELIQITILALGFVLAASGCTATATRQQQARDAHVFRAGGEYGQARYVPRSRPQWNGNGACAANGSGTRSPEPAPTVSTSDDTDDDGHPPASAPVTIPGGTADDAGGSDGATGPEATDGSTGDSGSLAGNLLREPDETAGPLAPNPDGASGPGLFDDPDGQPQVEEASASAVEPALVEPARKPTSRYVIIIDPGHGGRDPGGSGNGLVEKELALDVSLRLRRLLTKAGFTVKMTRTDDTYPTLAERIKFSRTHGGKLFLSVHANAFTKPESRGVETLYPSRGRQARNSRRFAGLVQRELAGICPTANRGAKADVRNLYLMRNAPCPLALAEMGFMTNKEDAAYLQQEDMREAIARSLFNGVVRYYNSTR